MPTPGLGAVAMPQLPVVQVAMPKIDDLVLQARQGGGVCPAGLPGSCGQGACVVQGRVLHDIAQPAHAGFSRVLLLHA